MIGAASHAGFNLVPNWWDGHFTFSPDAELRLTYSLADPSVNTAPVLSIAAPVEGGVFYEGVPINFSATALDAEDGDLGADIKWFSVWYNDMPTGPSFSKVFYPRSEHEVVATVTDSAGVKTTASVRFQVLSNTTPSIGISSPGDGSVFTAGQVLTFGGYASDPEDGSLSHLIAWTSNIDGSLGTGASLSSSQLTPGQHVISATVTDSVGAIATAQATIQINAVTNTPPEVTILAPSNGASIPDSQAISLQATAFDAQDGDLSSKVRWLSNVSGYLGQGAGITAFLTPGTHVITAQVQDRTTAVGSSSVTITVTANAAYCLARGNDASYEWIQGISVAGIGHSSGANGGYADFTQLPAIELARGANALTLTPGFRSSSYNESWNVWIDLNKNGIFEDSERLYGGASASAINTVLTVPETAAEGETRMRIAMQYGVPPSACGSFGYGEVEDYTVRIVGEGGGNPTPQYCASRSSNSNYEWIHRVATSGYTWTSGGSGVGYTDNTAGAMIDARRGAALSLQLTPGFASSGFTEHWRVWADLNRDGQFGSGELLYSGSSTGASTLNVTAQIPSTTATGTTRLRVSMKYGSGASPCETFTYGEVEDFTLNVTN